MGASEGQKLQNAQEDIIHEAQVWRVRKRNPLAGHVLEVPIEKL